MKILLYIFFGLHVRAANPLMLEYSCTGPSSFKFKVPYPPNIDENGNSVPPGYCFMTEGCDPNGKSVSMSYGLDRNGKNPRKNLTGQGYDVILASEIFKGETRLVLRTLKFVKNGFYSPKRACKDKEQKLGVRGDEGTICDSLPDVAPVYGDTEYKSLNINPEDSSFKIDFNKVWGLSGVSYSCKGSPNNSKVVQMAQNPSSGGSSRDSATSTGGR